MTGTGNYIYFIEKTAKDKDIFAIDGRGRVKINYTLLTKKLAEEVFLPITYRGRLFIREIDSTENTYCKGEDIVKSVLLQIFARAEPLSPYETYSKEQKEVLSRLINYNVVAQNPFNTGLANLLMTDDGGVEPKKGALIKWY